MNFLGPTVSPGDIWAALIANGASAVQAAAIMGNMIAESSLNPESAAQDSNGKMSYGLIQWNTGTYPSASTLVSGNPTVDLNNQVKFLASTGGFAAASGSDPSTAAANFAHTYERCSACGYQAGSGQLTVRSANAQAVYNAGQSGKWGGITAANGAAGAILGVSDATNNPKGLTIPNPLDGGLTDLTILNGTQVRNFKAFAFMGLGGFMILVGGAVLLASVTGTSSQVLQLIPGPAGAAVKATGAGQGKRRAPKPDADDLLADKATKERETAAASTGRTQEQRYREARDRTRTAAGPNARRHQRPRRSVNRSADPKDRAPHETPF